MAYVYLRQSSDAWHTNRGDRHEQERALADRARQLGFERVVVIDHDFGRSCNHAEERTGFAQLVTALNAGRVGAVIALDVTRFTRNKPDLRSFFNLCAATGALFIDAEGIYDPRLDSDRLTLGLDERALGCESA
jgi:DNA invertase Pin-like site-specific DNA recombinase